MTLLRHSSSVKVDDLLNIQLSSIPRTLKLYAFAFVTATSKSSEASMRIQCAPLSLTSRASFIDRECKLMPAKSFWFGVAVGVAVGVGVGVGAAVGEGVDFGVGAGMDAVDMLLAIK